MPAGRPDEYQEQGVRRKLAAERGQDHAIGSPPARPSSRASQDEQLLAEDEKFEIAIGSRATPDDEQVNQQAEEGIEQSQQHGAASVGPPELPVMPLAVACRRVSARLGGACPTTMGRAVRDHSPAGAGATASAVTIECTPRGSECR